MTQQSPILNTFVVDGLEDHRLVGNKKKENLDTAVFNQMVSRVEEIDKGLRSGIDSMREKNAELAAITAEMEELRNRRNNTKDKKEIDRINSELENLRGRFETATSISQLDMLNLQSSMYRFNNSLELASNFLRKFYSTLQNIIGNTR